MNQLFKKNQLFTSANISKKRLLIALLLGLFFSLNESTAQNQVFATTISGESHVSDSSNAIDEDLSTYANVKASSGVLLGIGAYNGYLELEFPTTLPANTTSYLKIETEDNLLDVLLGGELGGLLSDVLGVVLLGNQEFVIEAKNDDTVVQTGSSNTASDFSGSRLRVVTDKNNEKYIQITPDQPYNRLRVTNRLGSLIGLGNTKDLFVYGAFYYDAMSDCAQALYTSYSGTGLSLDLLDLGGAGVTNPEHVIDDNSTNYSELSLGILAVAATIQQTVYYPGLTNATDAFIVNLKVDPSLLALGVANNINISGYNGEILVLEKDLNSLLNLDLLTLLQGNQVAGIPFEPNAPIDRIVVSYTSLLNVQLTQGLDFYGVQRIPLVPVLDVSSEDVTICSGTSASLIAYSDPTDLEIRWYDAEIGGTLLGTTASGETFVTPILNTTTTLYVASGKPGCAEESARIPVEIEVLQSPTADDITVIGNEVDICAVDSAVIIPTSTLGTTFSWYISNDYSQPITDGFVFNELTFGVSTSGELTVSGFEMANAPYTFYVSVQADVTGCNNAEGDLKSVEISIIDTPTPTTDFDTQAFCTTDAATVADLDVNESGVIWYDVETGGTPLNATDLLTTGTYYASQIGANGCESGIRLEVEVFVNDGLTPTTNFPNQTFCVADGATVSDIDVNEVGVEWYSTETGGVPYDSSELLVTGTYYGAQVSGDNCGSATRLQVEIQVLDTPPPTTDFDTQTFCITDAATVADLDVNESGVIWYDVETGGTPLNATDLLTTGLYYASQLGTNGCESGVRLEVDVQVNPFSETTLTSDGGTDLCVGSTVTYTTVSGMSNYQWSVNGGTIIAGGTSTDDFATVTWDTNIDTNVSVTYDDAASCGGIATGMLDEVVGDCIADISDLEISKEVSNENPIPGETVLFTITVSNMGTTEFSGVEVSDLLPNGYSFVSATTTLGTYDEVTGSWIIPTLVANGIETLTVSATVNSTGDHLNIASIVISNPEDLNTANNTAEAEVSIECFTIYNEFSPNNDGINDYFEIECIENYSNNLIQIYNRYGNLVYEVNSYQNDWNGVANVSGTIKKGEVLPVGTYFYVLKIFDLNITKSGWIYLAK